MLLYQIDPKNFFWTALFVADVGGVDPGSIKTFLANGLSTFFIKGEPVFSNGPKSLPKNPTHCTILCNWVFDNFILVDEGFLKAIWRLENCLLVNNNLCGKLVSSLELPLSFDEIFNVTSVLLFSWF